MLVTANKMSPGQEVLDFKGYFKVETFPHNSVIYRPGDTTEARPEVDEHAVHVDVDDSALVSMGGRRFGGAGSLGILQLSSGEILPGSENVMLEIRDRRTPEVVMSRETLTRGIDYNLDPVTGQLFFLRYISTFDHLLNLTQIVVTYEHRANSMRSN